MKPYLLAVDSDGCAFDTMEVKHRRCFAPLFAEFFAAPAHRAVAEEVWRVVNLYSRERGINRYRGLVRCLEELAVHPDGGDVPSMPALSRWVADSPAHSGAALAEHLARLDSGRPTDTAAIDELQQVSRWSRAVDDAFEALVADVPAFDGVSAALADADRRASVHVVSSAPTAVLEQQWRDAGLNQHVSSIGGQEAGGKRAQLARLIAERGVAADHVLVLGDAPGDARAAAAVNARFFPIVPGREAVSWRRFRRDVFPRFVAGNWAERDEHDALRAFFDVLPEEPAWRATEFAQIQHEGEQ